MSTRQAGGRMGNAARWHASPSGPITLLLVLGRFVLLSCPALAASQQPPPASQHAHELEGTGASMAQTTRSMVMIRAMPHTERGHASRVVGPRPAHARARDQSRDDLAERFLSDLLCLWALAEIVLKPTKLSENWSNENGTS